MARPREFDTDEALEAAMQVFWQHGYRAASLPDLLDGMGLTRGSLYKAFRDKKTLFLQVLDRYETAAVDAGVSMLEDSAAGDGRTRILALFEGLVTAVEKGDHRGCLLCTAASGAASDDAEIAATVHRGLAKLQGGLETAIIDATALDAGDRRRLANTLLTQYIGLRMLARSRLSLGILEHSVQGVADILDHASD